MQKLCTKDAQESVMSTQQSKAINMSNAEVNSKNKNFPQNVLNHACIYKCFQTHHAIPNVNVIKYAKSNPTRQKWTKPYKEKGEQLKTWGDRKTI